MPSERVTVTMPPELVDAMDREERNRSKFIREAVRRELARRRRDAVRRSLESPHPESHETAEVGLEVWAAGLPPNDEDLLDPRAGTEVEWRPGEGWLELNR